MSKGFTDLHVHFVYGVDDGAQDKKTMESMLTTAHEEGVTALFATTHATPGLEPFPQEEYALHLEEARCFCAQQDWPIKLYSGAEILYTPAISHAVTEHTLPTLAGSTWVLLEYLPSVKAKELEAGLDLIAGHGYSIVLAHIERYACLEKGNLLSRLRQRYPVRYQVNGSTVLEPGGFWRRRKIESWFRDGLIDEVASDAHNCTTRPLHLRAAYEKLEQLYGTTAANSLLGQNDWVREIKMAPEV